MGLILPESAWTDEVIARINRGGEAMFGGVLWNDRRAVRISVVTGARRSVMSTEQSRRLVVRWLKFQLLVRIDDTHTVV